MSLHFIEVAKLLYCRLMASGDAVKIAKDNAAVSILSCSFQANAMLSYPKFSISAWLHVNLTGNARLNGNP